jgi:predicted nucleotidyltransferase
VSQQAITTRISAILDGIERQHGVTILLACESGSRAWGFASPDSDYDVRFVYTRPAQWYLRIDRCRDVIETPSDPVLDVGGWDLRKALQLMRKSNPPLHEWLASPIRYRIARSRLAPLQDLALRAFRPESACHHYLAMARHHWRQIASAECGKAKTYLYALRSVLCCRWIVTHLGPPPLRIVEVAAGTAAEPALTDALQGLIERKARQNESALAKRAAILDDHIAGELARLPAVIPKNPAPLPAAAFNRAFRAILARLPDAPRSLSA